MEPAKHLVLLCGVLTIMNGVVGLSTGDIHLRRTCGTETSANETSFMNPEYPASESGGLSSCVFTALPMTDDICQIRLDFDEFSLAQPNVDGQCVNDFMVVTGSYSNVPIVCGDNTGHHLYAEVDPSSSGKFKINIDTSVAGARWNIRITQIECNSLYKAPQGCLQYHAETSGVVSSFNYMTSTSKATGTRQLAEQQYAVCVAARPGYCGLTWEQPAGEEDIFFYLTGDRSVVPPGIPGPLLFGDDCQTDYVIISNAFFTDTDFVVRSTDRFCGFEFPSSVETTMSPYTILVVFDPAELTSPGADIANKGFSLAYRMNACVPGIDAVKL